LLSIGERAEYLAQSYEDRQLTTQQTLFEFEKLAREYIEAHAERRRMEVNENTFAIFTTVKVEAPEIRVEQAQDINRLFEQYPDYQWNEQHKSRLRTELYKTLRPIVGAKKMVDTTNALLRLQRV
jgi:type I restriction enzyme R subunit